MNTIPTLLSDKIKNTIHEKLHPKISTLIGKIFVIHLSTAVLTLSVCPQFGFKIFQLPINLMHTFMIFGISACNFLCGLFFTATSMTMVAFILNRDELRALRYQKTLSTASLILSSIGFFFIMNPNMFLDFSLLWLLGAILGVVLTLEMSSKVLNHA